ncbi:alpha/beta hydrolase [Rhabdothermincola salaria]|uniref:alpha/beta hydrolase n=1 Tax=Rhabdothermincola salaria TaxID=2903142 RepID=UPI001E63F4D7|nr:alpha/beta hydrolase [Rhabdothermincola salaria]MCD9624865.1 alpha/beta hydrolase [Rhabdothermincola salaria]
MRLWSEESEEQRDEARAVVTAGMAAIAEAFAGQGEPPADMHERAFFARTSFAQTFPAAEGSGVDRELAGVPCRLFVPDGRASAVYLHFHGGGMILGAPVMSDPANAALCRDHQLAVVSVDYRLAPEHPHPAGPDDGLAVAEWLLENAAETFGTDRLLIGGESAGGYMAAAVLLRLRDELGAGDRVDGANLVFGVYDWGLSPSQRGVRATDGPDMLDPDGIAMFGECYLPGTTLEERRAPEISPAFADLRGLPPALFSVGSADHLLDDTLLMATRWVAAGNEADLFVAPDMPHGFQAFPCAITTAWSRRTDEWFADILNRPARAAG